MKKESQYNLIIKPNNQEIINKCSANSLSEAINTFAIIKQLRPDQLLEIYSVYEQPPNGE